MAADLIEEWWNTPIRPDVHVLQRLHEHLERHADDVLLFHTVTPEVPDEVLTDYIEELPGEFNRVLRMYDDHVSGSLDSLFLSALEG